MVKRDTNCPLCGARLTAAELLDTCDEIVADQLGVLAARCPHCQGYLEVLPGEGRLQIGYTSGAGNVRFEVALSLPYEGLEAEHSDDPPGWTVNAPGRTWRFS